MLDMVKGDDGAVPPRMKEELHEEIKRGCAALLFIVPITALRFPAVPQLTGVVASR